MKTFGAGLSTGSPLGPGERRVGVLGDTRRRRDSDPMHILSLSTRTGRQRALVSDTCIRALILAVAMMTCQGRADARNDPRASGGLLINATFDTSITTDLNAESITNMINNAIDIHQSLFNDPITVYILFRYGDTYSDDVTPLPTGAVVNESTRFSIPWNTYINALKADATTANDTAANASLPGSAMTPYIVITGANGRAVGLPNTPPNMFYHGVGPFDGIITINNTPPLPAWTRPPAINQYDAQRATEHEIDELLGLGSFLNPETDPGYRPQDLFSWSAAGVRSVVTTGQRYFSINGGKSNLVNFNQVGGGLDYGDWAFELPCPQAHPYVQNAASCTGQWWDVTATSPEAINLDVIGYDLLPLSSVVGTGTVDSCSEAALEAALARGGKVTFNCGASPATIPVSRVFSVVTNKHIPATSVDGGGLITIDGGSSTQVFSNTVGGNLTLSNLMINNGASSGNGGAIDNEGTLTITNATFSGNSATGATSEGGAIYNGGTLTITNGTFSTNSAATGGAIASTGSALTISNSTFSGNNATGTTNGGGAIYSAVKLTITNSTFYNNMAADGGAVANGDGIAGSPRHGTLSITNSTFVTNTANSAGSAEGGAIYSHAYGKSTVTIKHSDFVGNIASGVTADGGAIYNEAIHAGRTIYGMMMIQNTIFAFNSTNPPSPVDPDCFSQSFAFIDAGDNLDDQTDSMCPLNGPGCTLDTKKGTSHCNVGSEDLGSYGNNGGPTDTIPVDPGSPAIERATCSPNTDQRGYRRVGMGNPKRCTIGAYEYQSPGCPAGLTKCGADQICTNLQNDPANCGACGNMCVVGQKCSKGRCS